MWMEVHKDPKEQALALQTMNRPSSQQLSLSKTANSQFWGSGSKGQGSTQGSRTQTQEQKALVPGTYITRDHQQLPPGLAKSKWSAQFQSRTGSRYNPGAAHSVSGVSEYGSPNPKNPSPMALIMRSERGEDGALLTTWADNFSKRFNHILNFTKKYTKGHKPGSEVRIQNEAPKIWAYMCELLYPGRLRDGAGHAIHLWNEDKARPYLVQRLVVQQAMLSMFGEDAWAGYDAATEAEMRDLHERLQAVDVFKPHERQEIIDRQAAILAKMMENKRWREFRSWKVNDHFQRFKKMIGPVVYSEPKSQTLEDAFFDLYGIVDSFFDLAIEIVKSRLSFQFVWNDTCTKFTAENHNAVNSDLPPITIQLKQWRLKLVMTPGITMRNDQGMNITPRQVLKSDVLVMH